MSSLTNKLSVYLLKSGYARIEDVVVSGATSIVLNDLGTFYFNRSNPRTPDWVTKFFSNRLDGANNLTVSSAKGLLLVSITDAGQNYLFAVCFGQGRFLLKPEYIEERFGLRVVLNTVAPGNLRSIDKTTLGSVPKQSREQMSREVMASDFGIDIEQDLISSVTGRSRKSEFGKTISGRDSLHVSVKVDASNIRDFLVMCLERYHSNDYKTDFAWIDQISEIRDPNIVTTLEGKLIGELGSPNPSSIWMAVPEIVTWEDIKGFKYRSEHEYVPDLILEEFMDVFSGRPVTIGDLKQIQVTLISEASDSVSFQWPAYNCFYAELEDAGKTYILNNGKWYEIETDFAKAVNDDFNSFTLSSISLPDYNSTVHATENKYNEAIATTTGYCLMDCKSISYGGGHSSIEFCDLMTPSKELIHVKKNGGSSVLSHLFMQGVVSGELLASDAAFRKKVNAKLAPGFKIRTPDKRPDVKDYEVVFGIITEKPTLNIPFFSKVSLRNARRRLNAFGYKNVSLMKIDKR
ncbi:TIGR04141 family sporadically distributed protein [Flavobacterium sp.]|uniref:TIGR04141 family sporadically distributed protein n=1 Tax=Flavobacterium sp. TaxID=239 RepID=UPI0040341E9E